MTVVNNVRCFWLLLIIIYTDKWKVEQWTDITEIEWLSFFFFPGLNTFSKEEFKMLKYFLGFRGSSKDREGAYGMV